MIQLIIIHVLITLTLVFANNANKSRIKTQKLCIEQLIETKTKESNYNICDYSPKYKSCACGKL